MRLTSVALLVLVAGCTNKYSGFLDDKIYSQLKPGEKPGSMFWIKEGADLRAYDYLLIEPVVCMPDEGSELTAEQKGKASKAFHDILVEKVDPYYPVVTKPAQHVLRVRIALTELTPTGDMGVGAAALEVDFRDAQTNEVLCAGVSRIEGSERGKEAKREWQAVEGAFYEWADRLLEFMDSYHLEK
ncbi:MAG: DUF3313 domain-containing protein [Planctomycetota bacterium]|jgi:hypothetical protein